MKLGKLAGYHDILTAQISGIALDGLDLSAHIGKVVLRPLRLLIGVIETPGHIGKGFGRPLKVIFSFFGDTFFSFESLLSSGEFTFGIGIAAGYLAHIF